MENHRPRHSQGPVGSISPLLRHHYEDGKLVILHQDRDLVRDSPGIKPLQVAELPIWPHHPP